MEHRFAAYLIIIIKFTDKPKKKSIFIKKFGGLSIICACIAKQESGFFKDFFSLYTGDYASVSVS
jgi:hypothetical protein